MSLLNTPLHELDPDIAAAVDAELHRQQSTLEMIASENFAPVAVMEAQGSVLTNKYAEGYPGRRYYGGCEHVDVVEQIAIDRIKALFGAEAANVQPHSGAQANAAAMFALLKPGDTIMGLNLAHGGHLTHGMKINFSGKLYNVVPYHVDETGEVDMAEVERLAKKINSAVFPGQQGGPLEHVIAAKAVSFKVAASPEFKERQQRTLDGARILAERLVQPDVTEVGVSVLSGGTDVHLVLVDLRNSELDGQQAEDRLHELGITVNRNAIPNDPRPPMVTSGLRIGTPALATRGFGAEDFTEVAEIIAAALKPSYDADALKARVVALAEKFPLYSGLK